MMDEPTTLNNNSHIYDWVKQEWKAGLAMESFHPMAIPLYELMMVSIDTKKPIDEKEVYLRIGSPCDFMIKNSSRRAHFMDLYFYDRHVEYITTAVQNLSKDKHAKQWVIDFTELTQEINHNQQKDFNEYFRLNIKQALPDAEYGYSEIEIGNIKIHLGLHTDSASVDSLTHSFELPYTPLNQQRLDEIVNKINTSVINAKQELEVQSHHCPLVARYNAMKSRAQRLIDERYKPVLETYMIANAIL